MFKIQPSAHGYIATLEKTGDRYFCGHIKPTQGYPKKAKYPYKADISLMKMEPDSTGVNQMTFHRLSRGNAQARAIISAITPELCAYLDREAAIAAAVKQEEEEKYTLLEQNLDDIIEGE